MKIITPPLETRYQELKIKATCRTQTCQAGFEVSGEDLHPYKAEENYHYLLAFTCPYCKAEIAIAFDDVKDNQLFDYIYNKNA